jgi:glycine cleavage system aminomethyltransferase T
VLLRLGEDHFWLSLADSDVLLWALGVAHGSGLDVTIREPDVGPVQVQGPKSKDVMVDLAVIGPSHIRRIEGGILAYGADMWLDTNPYEVGMGYDWMVDLEQKADFIGKEALARIKQEGTKRKLAGVEIAGNSLGSYNVVEMPFVDPKKEIPKQRLVTGH